MIVHNFYRFRGGEDRAVEVECGALARAGIDVETQFWDSRDIPGDGSAKLALASIWSASAGAKMAAAIARAKPDIVHFHNIFPLPSPSVLHAARAAGCAVVRTLHNYRVVCANGLLLRDGGPCEDCVATATGWPALRHACYRERRDATLAVLVGNAAQRAVRRRNDPVDRYIALSGFAAERFRAAGIDPTRLSVIPPLLSAPVELPTGPRAGFLWVGRLSGEKGLDFLADVWRGLDLPLTLIGDGPDAEKWRAHAPPSWHFVGPRPPIDVASAMRAAAVLLFPSRAYENFAMAVGEAMSHGMAVAASARGAAIEMLDRGGAGLLLPPDDVQAWRDAILSLSHAPDRTAEFGRRARVRFEANYSPTVALPQRIALYRTLVAARP